MVFEFRCETIKVHIFDFSNSTQTDIFNMTIKDIVNYIGITYKYRLDIRTVIQNLKPHEMASKHLRDSPGRYQAIATDK